MREEEREPREDQDERRDGQQENQEEEGGWGETALDIAEVITDLFTD